MAIERGNERHGGTRLTYAFGADRSTLLRLETALICDAFPRAAGIGIVAATRP